MKIILIVAAIIIASIILVAVLCANRAAGIADYRLAQMRRKEEKGNGNEDN